VRQVSHRQRAKVSRRLWSTLLSIASRNIFLEDDPLGRQYEVNRHNLHVYHNQQSWLEEIRVRLIAHLLQAGWTHAEWDWGFKLKSPENNVEIMIGKIDPYPGRGYRFGIGVH
jgi:hypothetical protein